MQNFIHQLPKSEMAQFTINSFNASFLPQETKTLYITQIKSLL